MNEMSSCPECFGALEMLGLSPSATAVDIKQAHRDLVKVWHPDRFEAESRVRAKAEAQLKQVNSAHDHLQQHWTAQEKSPPEVVDQGWTTVRTEPTEPSQNYEADGYSEAEPDTRSDISIGLRYLKVLLRVVWRVFRIVVLALLAILVTFLAVLGLVAALSDYWRNEERIHGEPFFQSPGKQLFTSISEFTGLPQTAARGFVFLFSALFLCVAAFGEVLWDIANAHAGVSVSVLALLALLVLLWAFLREQAIEFKPVPIGARPPSNASWVMGTVVLAALGCACPFVVNASRSRTAQAATNAVSIPEVSNRTADVLIPARRNVLLWDFRTVDRNTDVPDDVKNQLREVVAPLSDHPDALTFQGPTKGNFLGAMNGTQALYTVSLDWLTAEHSHAEGDRVFAVILGNEPRTWELEGGGPALRAFPISEGSPDLLVTSPTWSGQGQTQTILKVFSLAKPAAKAVASTTVAYDDDCATDTATGAVADRVFVDVNPNGDIAVSRREHWFTPCEKDSSFKLIGKNSSNAEDVLINLRSVSPLLQSGVATSSLADLTPQSAGMLAGAVSSSLATWARFEESNDPEQEAQAYAGQIDRYFLSRNVTRQFVQDYMTTWLQQHSQRVVTFIPKDIHLEDAGDGAVRARLIKDVVTRDDQGTSERFTRSTLLLRKEDGSWKIFSEQDFK